LKNWLSATASASTALAGCLAALATHHRAARLAILESGAEGLPVRWLLPRAVTLGVAWVGIAPVHRLLLAEHRGRGVRVPLLLRQGKIQGAISTSASTAHLRKTRCRLADQDAGEKQCGDDSVHGFGAALLDASSQGKGSQGMSQLFHCVSNCFFARRRPCISLPKE
jgi:hypothetical protein